MYTAKSKPRPNWGATALRRNRMAAALHNIRNDRRDTWWNATYVIDEYGNVTTDQDGNPILA